MPETMPVTPAPRRYPWKTFLFLVACGTLTGPLVIPYFLGLAAIAPAPQPPVPGSLLPMVLGAFGRNLVFLVPAAGLGLLLARRLGLGAPCLGWRVWW